MWSIIKENPRAVFFAILVHVIFAGVMIFSFSNSTSNVAVHPEVNIVKATVIDEAKIRQEKQRKQALARQKEQARKEAQRKKLEAKKKAEAKRQVELKKKQQLALKKKQQAAEKKRQAELEQKRKLELQKAAELKKKQEQEQADQQKREAELKQQMEEENARLAQQAKRAGQQKEVDKYQALIKQAISNKWIVPVSATEGMECVLRLRLIPSGEVIGVELVRSSGDPRFDRSVEAAVRKASPLPLPPAESGLFGEFREINMPFRLEKKI